MRVALERSSLNFSEGSGALRSAFHSSRSMWSRDFLASFKTGLARLTCRPSAYRLWFQGALAPTRLKLWRNLTEVSYRCFLAILHSVILAKHDVFIDFYLFQRRPPLSPDITIDIQRLK